MSIEKNELINLAISARGLSNSSKLIIKLKNGLSNESTGSAFPASNLSSLINPMNEQVLLNQTLTTDWTTYFITNVTVEQLFSQIWIYSEVNALKIDQFSINVSCCKLKEEYQNITNPPSTYRNDYIKAGEIIDNNRTQGKVIINNTSSTTFQAKNRITLDPGFEVINGSTFVAQIDLCTNLATTIDVEKRKSPCEHEYIARICNGSGFYSYAWNLNGMEAIGSTNDYKVKFKPRSQGTVTLTVTDLSDNSQTSTTINLGYVPFTGNFPLDSFNTGNAISPNGDGINDTWLIIDVAKPNTSVFAYDAHSIRMDIYDRGNGLRVFLRNETDRFANGFPDRHVEWVPDNPVTEDVYYTITEFRNCYNTLLITQTITIFGAPVPPPWIQIVLTMKLIIQL